MTRNSILGVICIARRVTKTVPFEQVNLEEVIEKQCAF